MHRLDESLDWTDENMDMQTLTFFGTKLEGKKTWKRYKEVCKEKILPHLFSTVVIKPIWKWTIRSSKSQAVTKSTNQDHMFNMFKAKNTEQTHETWKGIISTRSRVVVNSIKQGHIPYLNYTSLRLKKASPVGERHTWDTHETHETCETNYTRGTKSRQWPQTGRLFACGQ